MAANEDRVTGPKSIGRGGWSRDYLVAGVGLVGAFLGAAIGLVATLMATSAASGDETSRQLREMKQQQYILTYRAVDQEIRSYFETLALLRRGAPATPREMESYVEEMRVYRGKTDAAGLLAGMPMVANEQVLEASIDLVYRREEALGGMATIATSCENKEPPSDAQLESVFEELTTFQLSSADLLAAMRQDLHIL